jgi:hypothetical protein
MVSVKNPNTLVREWVNDVGDNIVYLDKLGIEDAVKYHDAEMIEIIQAVGYPWINGVNKMTNKIYKNVSFRYSTENESVIEKMISKFIPSLKPLPNYITSNKLF